MKFSLIIADNGRYLISKREGTWTRKDDQIFLQHLHEIQEAGAKLGSYNYLIDLTNAVNGLSPVDVFELANHEVPEHSNLRRLARMALLVSPNDKSFDFMETVSINAGYNFRLFRNRTEAIAFLSESSSRKHLSLVSKPLLSGLRAEHQI